MTGVTPPSAPIVSKEDDSDRPLAQPPRLKSACEACHASKVRCTGRQPCTRCASNGWECIYKLASRIGKPKGSRNKSTLRRLQLEKEQAERDLAGNTSIHSSASGSVPSSTLQGCTEIVSAETIRSPESPFPVSAEDTCAVWHWSSGSGPWLQTGDTEGSATSTLGIAGATDHSRSGDLLLPFEAATAPYDGVASNIGLLSDGRSSHSSFGAPQERNIGICSQYLLDQANYLGTEATYDYAQLSPSIAVESHSPRGSSPTYTFMTSDSTSGFELNDPYWAAQSCNCNRHLSWQLTRVNQLRKGFPVDTTLRGLTFEANEAVQRVREFLRCEICDKGSTCLSLMVLIFANISHLFTLTTTQSTDHLAVFFRDPDHPFSPLDAERLRSEAAVARGLIRHWLNSCEQAIGVVQSLISRATATGESSTGKGKQPDLEEASHVILWGPLELDSFWKMLWTAKQNFETYV